MKEYNILYVDDEQANLNSLKSLFRRKFNFLTAISGKKGLEILEEQPVHLIIVDQRMPGMTGIEFLKKVKEKWPDIKSILLTAFYDNKVIKEAVNEVGLYWYMNKPFENEKLEHVIRKAQDAYRSENLLKESEKKFTEVFESMVDVFVRRDMDGIGIMVSPSVFDVLGYTQDEIIGKKLAPFYADSRAPEMIKNKLLEGVGTQRFEIDLFKKDGNIITVSTNAKLYHDEAGNPIGIESVLRDITKQKKAEKLLKESEEKFKGIFNSLIDVFIRRDFLNKGVMVSPSILEITGYVEEEIVGQDISKYFVDPEKPEWIRQYLMKNRGVQTVEFDLYKKDGTIIHISSNAKIYNDEAGNPIGIESVLRDVTDKKVAEEVVRESKERYQSLSDASFEAIFISEKGVCIEQNALAEKMFGYSLAEAIGRPGTDWIIPKDGEVVKNNMLTGYEKPYEVTALRKDGSTFPAEIQGRMMHLKGRDVRVTALSDISKRKLAEEALVESEEKYRLLFNSNPLLIAWIDASGRYKTINASYMAFFGIKSEDVVGKHISEILSETLYTNLNKSINQAQKGKKSEYEVSTKDKNGKSHYLYGRLVPHINSEGVQNGFIVIVEDITEQKQAKEKLQESEQKFKTLVTNTEEIIYMIAKDGTFLLSEGKGLEKLGLKGGDVVGQSIFDLYKDYPEMLDKMDQAFKGETVIMEHEIGDVDFKSWYTPHLNQKGEKIGLLGMSINITEQKQAEIKVQEYQDRLKALALELTLTEEKMRKQIAVELHDDVGQLLSASRMQLATLNCDAPQTETKKKINNISQGLLGAIRSTREAIFNLSPPQLNEIGLYAAIHDWMKEQVEQKYGISTRITGNRETIPIDENTRFLVFRSIRELIMNVVKHAKASHLNIIIERDSRQLEITVQDDGIGFHYDSDLNKLKSMTYGLFSIKERMSDMGGSITIESKKGFGTKIKLVIPMVKG